MKCLAKIFMFVCVCFVVSCQEVDIVHDLQERDANEILVVLNRHQIKALKEKSEKNQEITWIIKVDGKDEQTARAVLVANNLPRVRLGGLKGICKDSSMILTPKTEKCRELLAYKEEIINLLESVACVVTADVVLNIPEKEEFPDANSLQLHPTATATVKFLKDCTTGTKLSEQRVQDIVANAVSGLDPRDVTVVLSLLDSGLPGPPTDAGQTQTVPTDCPQLTTPSSDASVELVQVAGLSMDKSSAKTFKMMAAVFLLLFLLIAAAFVYVLLKSSKTRKALPAESKALAKAEEDK